MSLDAGAHSECEVIIAPPAKCAAMGMVELELVCLPGKALTWDATRRLRFVVHATRWLHSMVLHGCCRQVLAHLPVDDHMMPSSSFNVSCFVYAQHFG